MKNMKVMKKKNFKDCSTDPMKRRRGTGNWANGWSFLAIAVWELTFSNVFMFFMVTKIGELEPLRGLQSSQNNDIVFFSLLLFLIKQDGYCIIP